MEMEKEQSRDCFGAGSFRPYGDVLMILVWLHIQDSSLHSK